MGPRLRPFRSWAVALAILGGFLMGLAPAGTAQGQAPKAALLSQADRADIGRIERHINEIGTLQSRFLQVTSTGSFSQGTLYLWRPGRLRVEYDPPEPMLIVANGTWLIYEDKKLEQITQLPLAATPASILVADSLSLFSDAFIITGFERGPASLRLTIVRAKDPLAGSVTLIFSDRPLALKKWIVIDAQGIATTVSLLQARLGIPLNPELFQYDLPEDPSDRQ